MKKYVNGKYTDMTENEIKKLTPPVKMQISDLKQKLSDTDYIACKIAEGAATKEEYAEILAQRQAWRNEINTLLIKEA